MGSFLMSQWPMRLKLRLEHAKMAIQPRFFSVVTPMNKVIKNGFKLHAVPNLTFSVVTPTTYLIKNGSNSMLCPVSLSVW